MLLRLAIAWLAFALLWLLFAFQINGSELAAACLASALTVVGGYVALRAVPMCFHPSLRQLAQVWRLPAMVVSDTWLLLKHLYLSCRGCAAPSSFKLARFGATGQDCQSAAQRSLATLLVSISPNSIVLDFDRDKGHILFHELEPAPLPELLRKLQS